MLGLAGEADHHRRRRRTQTRRRHWRRLGGLEAACAPRAHQVALFGADTEIGGALRPEARLPGRATWPASSTIKHARSNVIRSPSIWGTRQRRGFIRLDAEAAICDRRGAAAAGIDAAADAPLISGRDYMPAVYVRPGGGTVMPITTRPPQPMAWPTNWPRICTADYRHTAPPFRSGGQLPQCDRGVSAIIPSQCRTGSGDSDRLSRWRGRWRTPTALGVNCGLTRSFMLRHGVSSPATSRRRPRVHGLCSVGIVAHRAI